MRFLHTMIRVRDIDESLDFWCHKMGLKEVRRTENAAGKFTLIFLVADEDVERSKTHRGPELELTYNWGSEEVYETGRSWGHLAYTVEDIYIYCQKLMDAGVTINRPPRDGRMAFVKSPDGVSIEILQKGLAKDPAEPWISMKNKGSW
ncbi:MAG: VOC family protein [Pseudomonadota bacterium]